ncbi:DUF3822 family protein [Tamlana sp. 2201CG12-4]|uniref:DUF3822 family protein n=1 Tax=Tamlana sp. 2201CG12-4 TaxID=3112582 RepID=UPI002DC026A2|nr:DUF3822 family protein [Tamlana sp. 2201CG12-4]MEC3908182.1 DUF3822 family protein [Tamlana sp. 2201CG12-4]
MRLKLLETGQKPMAQTNNNTTNKLTNQELSIQISLSGLSFCILNRQSNSIVYLKESYFDKKCNPLEVLDYLKHLFNTEDVLNSHFDKVFIIHDNELSVQVPKPLFNEEGLADYLKFNSKILKSDYITYDIISENDIVNVYVPYININNFIYDKFGDFTFKHVSTVLIEEILRIEKNAKHLKFYVNIDKDHFEAIVVDNGKLLFYNTFNYASKEDFIYYILFVAEQLSLNPETFNLVLIGDIKAHDYLYNIAYKYIRNVDFGHRTDTFKFESMPATNYSNFTLLKSI